MSQNRYPLRVNVGFMLNTSIGIFRDIHFEYEIITLQDDFTVTDFNGVARVSRTPQGILVKCNFSGKAQMQCRRCLEDTFAPLQTEFSELYAFNERSVTESNLILREDANIDLEPITREYLELELPISQVCKPDCKGLCPVCGQNLNQALCEHACPPSE